LLKVKFRLQVTNDLTTRGVNDILIALGDGQVGNTPICSVKRHLSRNSGTFARG
jgi:hypothetical protein